MKYTSLFGSLVRFNFICLAIELLSVVIANTACSADLLTDRFHIDFIQVASLDGYVNVSQQAFKALAVRGCLDALDDFNLFAAPANQDELAALGNVVSSIKSPHYPRDLVFLEVFLEVSVRSFSALN